MDGLYRYQLTVRDLASRPAELLATRQPHLLSPFCGASARYVETSHQLVKLHRVVPEQGAQCCLAALLLNKVDRDKEAANRHGVGMVMVVTVLRHGRVMHRGRHHRHSHLSPCRPGAEQPRE
jgi:hypothetical protein